MSAASAPDWLDTTFGVPSCQVQALCPGRTIRDWLLDATTTGQVSYLDARYAALLTRHLGLVDEFPGVLALAERAREEARKRWSRWGSRRVTGTGDEVPARLVTRAFLRFLEEIPPQQIETGSASAHPRPTRPWSSRVATLNAPGLPSKRCRSGA